MTIEDRCRVLMDASKTLTVPEHHFELWVEYNVRHSGLSRQAADELLRLKDEKRLANYESVRRASRKIINR